MTRINTISHPRLHDLDSTIDHVGTLDTTWQLAVDSIRSTHIDWGLGANQVNSDDVPDHNTHTVHDVFLNTINRGVSDAITVALTGGLNISWTAGEVYDETNNIFVTTNVGNGAVTNNLVNYLKWVSGNTLTLNTTAVSGDQVLVSTILVQDNVIEGHLETQRMDSTTANTRRGLRALFPTRVVSGMIVHEDVDITNPLDVTMDVGVAWKEVNSIITPVEIKSRTVAMVRHFHTGGAWDSDNNAEIDTTNYDNGNNLVAAPVNKWMKAFFFYSNNKIGWVYPTTYYNIEAQALEASLPAMPPGLEPAPKLTAIVYKRGDATFVNTTWQDIRPGISEEAFNIVTDHGALVGLGDDDHPQYLLADGSRALAGAWDMGNQALTNVNIDSGDINVAVTQTEWDAAYTHIGESGSSHTYLNQSVTTVASPTFVALTLSGAITGITTLSMNNQLTNSLAIGTAPFVITSTTKVDNLHVARATLSDTVTNATFTTALIVNTGTLTLTANVANSSVLTIGAGAVSVSGSNTGDNTVCTSGAATTAETLLNARTIGNVSFNGSANIVPETIAIVDESADTSCNVAFFTAATGSLQPKTGTNLTFNSSTGLLTATTIAAANANWDAAYTHVSNNGTDHSYINQDLQTTASPTFVGVTATLTGNATTATTLANARTIGGVSFNGSVNIVPTTIMVADTTDASCFVGLWESATGSLLPKTDAGLTYNASTGLLTATGFSGPLTGNVTGNVSGSSGSCTGNSATSTLASTVTVVDESADTSCYVNYTTAASGSLALKTGTNLTFNSSTGLLTSTLFSDGTFSTNAGAFTGVVSLNLISDTAYAASWNGDTTIAPSKNAVYDKINDMISDSTAGLDGDTTSAPSRNVFHDLVLHSASAFPGSPVDGQLFYDTDDEGFYRYDSTATAWIQVGGGGYGSVSDTAYAASWDAVTDVAPSKNAVYDYTVAQHTRELSPSLSPIPEDGVTGGNDNVYWHNGYLMFGGNSRTAGHEAWVHFQLPDDYVDDSNMVFKFWVNTYNIITINWGHVYYRGYNGAAFVNEDSGVGSVVTAGSSAIASDTDTFDGTNWNAGDIVRIRLRFEDNAGTEEIQLYSCSLQITVNMRT